MQRRLATTTGETESLEEIRKRGELGKERWSECADHQCFCTRCTSLTLSLSSSILNGEEMSCTNDTIKMDNNDYSDPQYIKPDNCDNDDEFVIVQKKNRGKWKRRQKNTIALAITFAIILVTFLSFDMSFYEEEVRRSLRNISTSCKLNTPYVRVQDVTGWMPHVTVPKDRNPPSHIALCEAYIDRIDDAADTTYDQFVFVKEDPSFCTDWTAPHFSVMTIYASSLIAEVGKRLGLRYMHGCHRTIGNYKFRRDNAQGQVEQITTHWDFTTVQQLLVENLVTQFDAEHIDESIMKQLCMGCIAFHQNHIPPASYSTASHQCLLFPGAVEKTSQVALRSVLPSVVDRLQKSSQDWMQHTAPLNLEDQTGVIIYLDDTSSFLHYTVYHENIPSEVTSVQIFLSASCARASALGESSCVEHGRRIKRYFIQTRGVYGGTYVRIDVVASTAASFTRMVAVKTLICPPGSVSCLLPAVSKNPGTVAVIVEAASHPVTYAWFIHLQGMEEIKDSIVVVSVNEDKLDMPVELIGEARKRAIAAAKTEEEKKEGNLMHQFAQEKMHLRPSEDDTEVLTLLDLSQNLAPVNLSTPPVAAQGQHLSADGFLGMINKDESNNDEDKLEVGNSDISTDQVSRMKTKDGSNNNEDKLEVGNSDTYANQVFDMISKDGNNNNEDQLEVGDIGG